MTKYYFVSTMLPALSFDVPPRISFAELIQLLNDHLRQKDNEKILAIRSFFDILNLRSLWLGKDLDPRGISSSQELEEAFVSRSGLPDYVYEFVDKYPNPKDRINHFSYLLTKFFQNYKELHDPFLQKYLHFERELRFIMAAFRAKKMNRDLSIELQYENPEEELIAQLLAQKDSKMVEFPEKFKDLKEIFEANENQPLALQKEIDKYRFEKIDQFIDMADVFSIERILAYFLQFILLEKWFRLDQERGIHIIDQIVNEMFSVIQ